MPRITLTIASLLLLTSSALIAANDNPFARWESLQKKTEPVVQKASTVATAKQPPAAPTESGAPPKSGSVEYFSATSETKTSETSTAGKATAVTPEPASSGTNVKRERLRSALVKKGSSTKSAATGEVKTADFTGNKTKRAIQQTGADFLDDFNAENTNSGPNPFEEFLGSPDAAGEELSFDKEPSGEPSGETSPEIPAEEFGGVPRFTDPTTDGTGDFTTVGFGEMNHRETATFGENPTAQLPSVISGPQTPSVTLQWVHHGEFSLGQECRCDLVVQNSGQSPVRNVVAEAVLPQGLQVVKAEPAPGSVEGSATWTFGELEAGEKRTIELVVIPEQEGDTQISAFVRLTGASISTFAVTQPQLAVKVEGPTSVEVGQQVNYTLRVANPGTGTARNVVIQAAIPEGLEHRQGGMLSIDIGTLNPGEQRRARLSVTGVKGGEHRLAVRVVGDGGIQEQATETIAVAEPRLNIGVRGAATARAGQVADYELIVVNEGRVDSSNVRAKYKVPTGFEFVQADVGGKYNSKDQTIDWFVGTLEPNQVRQFRVTLRPTVPGAVTHQVGVISEHGKMTMAEHETTVQGNAELSMKLASNRSRIAAGDLVSYEVQVNNVGQSAAQNVGISCELPPGLELVKITAPSEYIADNGVVIFRSLPELDSGKSVTVTVQARCQRAGRHRVRVRVASESIEEALIDEESTIATNR